MPVAPHEKNKALARLIDHMRLPNFPQELCRYLAEMVQFDTCLMLLYQRAEAPIFVYTESTEKSRALQKYLQTDYRLDPLYLTIFGNGASGVIRLKTIQPERFSSSAYYQDCYQEFQLEDEVNLVIPIDEDAYFTVALGRKSRLGSIKRQDLIQLREQVSVLSALTQQFWQVCAENYSPETSGGSTLALALRTFGQGLVTRREQQILVLVIQGLSSQAIAEQLNISLGTVKVHRKNIHNRFHTTAHADLFGLFLNHLNQLEMRNAA